MIPITPELRKFIYCLFAHIDTYSHVEDCDTKRRMTIVMDILDANQIPKSADSEQTLYDFSVQEYVNDTPDYLALLSSSDCALYEKKLELIKNLEQDRIEMVDVPLRLVCTAIKALPTVSERVDFIEELESYIVGALQANYSKNNPELHDALQTYYQLEEEEEDVG